MDRDQDRHRYSPPHHRQGYGHHNQYAGGNGGHPPDRHQDRHENYGNNGGPPHDGYRRSNFGSGYSSNDKNGGDGSNDRGSFQRSNNYNNNNSNYYSARHDSSGPSPRSSNPTESLVAYQQAKSSDPLAVGLKSSSTFFRETYDKLDRTSGLADQYAGSKQKATVVKTFCEMATQTTEDGVLAQVSIWNGIQIISLENQQPSHVASKQAPSSTSALRPAVPPPPAVASSLLKAVTAPLASSASSSPSAAVPLASEPTKTKPTHPLDHPSASTTGWGEPGVNNQSWSSAGPSNSSHPTKAPQSESNASAPVDPWQSKVTPVVSSGGGGLTIGWDDVNPTKGVGASVDWSSGQVSEFPVDAKPTKMAVVTSWDSYASLAAHNKAPAQEEPQKPQPHQPPQSQPQHQQRHSSKDQRWTGADSEGHHTKPDSRRVNEGEQVANREQSRADRTSISSGSSQTIFEDRRPSNSYSNSTQDENNRGRSLQKSGHYPSESASKRPQSNASQSAHSSQTSSASQERRPMTSEERFNRSMNRYNNNQGGFTSTGGETSASSHGGTGGYGASGGSYGASSGGYCASSGGYGAASGGYGASSGGYGAASGGYGASSGGYGASGGGYGASGGGHGASGGGYGGSDGGRGSSDGGRGSSDGGRRGSDGGHGPSDFDNQPYGNSAQSRAYGASSGGTGSSGYGDKAKNNSYGGGYSNAGGSARSPGYDGQSYGNRGGRSYHGNNNENNDDDDNNDSQSSGSNYGNYSQNQHYSNNRGRGGRGRPRGSFDNGSYRGGNSGRGGSTPNRWNNNGDHPQQRIGPETAGRGSYKGNPDHLSAVSAWSAASQKSASRLGQNDRSNTKAPAGTESATSPPSSVPSTSKGPGLATASEFMSIMMAAKAFVPPPSSKKAGSTVSDSHNGSIAGSVSGSRQSSPSRGRQNSPTRPPHSQQLESTSDHRTDHQGQSVEQVPESGQEKTQDGLRQLAQVNETEELDWSKEVEMEELQRNQTSPQDRPAPPLIPGLEGFENATRSPATSVTSNRTSSGGSSAPAVEKNLLSFESHDNGNNHQAESKSSRKDTPASDAEAATTKSPQLNAHAGDNASGSKAPELQNTSPPPQSSPSGSPAVPSTDA